MAEKIDLESPLNTSVEEGIPIPPPGVINEKNFVNYNGTFSNGIISQKKGLPTASGEELKVEFINNQVFINSINTGASVLYQHLTKDDLVMNIVDNVAVHPAVDSMYVISESVVGAYSIIDRTMRFFTIPTADHPSGEVNYVGQFIINEELWAVSNLYRSQSKEAYLVCVDNTSASVCVFKIYKYNNSLNTYYSSRTINVVKSATNTFSLTEMHKYSYEVTGELGRGDINATAKNNYLLVSIANKSDCFNSFTIVFNNIEYGGSTIVLKGYGYVSATGDIFGNVYPDGLLNTGSVIPLPALGPFSDANILSFIRDNGKYILQNNGYNYFNRAYRLVAFLETNDNIDDFSMNYVYTPHAVNLGYAMVENPGISQNNTTVGYSSVGHWIPVVYGVMWNTEFDTSDLHPITTNGNWDYWAHGQYNRASHHLVPKAYLSFKIPVQLVSSTAGIQQTIIGAHIYEFDYKFIPVYHRNDVFWRVMGPECQGNAKANYGYIYNRISAPSRENSLRPLTYSGWIANDGEAGFGQITFSDLSKYQIIHFALVNTRLIYYFSYGGWYSARVKVDEGTSSFPSSGGSDTCMYDVSSPLVIPSLGSTKDVIPIAIQPIPPSYNSFMPNRQELSNVTLSPAPFNAFILANGDFAFANLDGTGAGWPMYKNKKLTENSPANNVIISINDSSVRIVALFIDNYNGDTPDDIDTIARNITIPYVNAIREGYTSGAWHNVENNTEHAQGSIYFLNANRHFWLRWTANTYTFTYSYGEGTGIVGPLPPTGVFQYDGAYTWPGNTLTRDGYVQYYWKDSVTDERYEPETGNRLQIAHDIAFVPDWLVLYTMTFSTVGTGIVGVLPPTKVTLDEEWIVSETTVYKDGSVFAGFKLGDRMIYPYQGARSESGNYVAQFTDTNNAIYVVFEGEVLEYTTPFTLPGVDSTFDSIYYSGIVLFTYSGNDLPDGTVVRVRDSVGEMLSNKLVIDNSGDTVKTYINTQKAVNERGVLENGMLTIGTFTYSGIESFGSVGSGMSGDYIPYDGVGELWV